MKKTALYEKHVEANAKIVDFAGYALPIQYSGIVSEHNFVREKCGVFDVSHMGEILVEGDKAENFVQYIITNDISDLETGRIRYSPMCYADGGCVDDVLIYKVSDKIFYIVVNASNKDKDYKWMLENNIFDDVKIEDVSDSTSQIAVQGPKAYDIVRQVFEDIPEKYYTFTSFDLEDGSFCVLSRTGYTGEDGFEIYTNNDNIQSIWDKLFEAGGEDIAVCGLGARDTLRLEASMPLYGHEISKDITPLEAELGRFVKIEKSMDFLGKNSLAKQKEEGLKRRKCGIKLIGRGIARENAEVFVDREKVGYITSGTKSITLKDSIGLALLNRPYNKIGTKVEVQVRNKMIEAEVVKTPFYKK